MNNWLTFLQQKGAQIVNGKAVSFEESTDQYDDLLKSGALFSLDSSGLLAFSGQDSKKFLQGQVTADVQALHPGTVLPGAICTAKGRMVANFHLVERSDENLIMHLHRELTAPCQSHLGKFAVFFKTSIADVSSNFICLGLAGEKALAALGTVFGTQIPEQIGHSQEFAEILISCVAESTFICIIPNARAEKIWEQLAVHCRPAGLPCWNLWNIRQGLGQVCAATREEFIPQMLNLQATGAISFRKGCYTGQEIVARMRYLGKLKRRMYRLRLSGNQLPLPAPGQICHAPGTGQNIGSVVMAAPATKQGYEILAVLTEEGSAAGELQIDNSLYQCTTLTLPYDSELLST